MSHYPLIFLCPTYNRPVALADFVAAFGNNIVKHKHAEVPLRIVDDSIGTAAEANVKAIKGAAPSGLTVQYVGEQEKQEVLSYLEEQTKISARNLNRIFKSPCYGANRNWTLLYSFGEFYISSDDDMWPYATFLKNRPEEALEQPGWSGAFMRRKKLETDAEQIEFDQVGSYLRFLGKKVSDFPELAQGDILFDAEADTAASLHASYTGEVKVSFGQLSERPLDPNSIIKFVNPAISGDGDIDSEDIIINFMHEGTNDLLRGREEYKYLIERLTPCLTKESWRISPAVLGVDNREGVLPYAPTSFRFEDFVFRIYAAVHPNVATACPDFAQHHERSIEARSTIVADFFNEETARIMKYFLKNNVQQVNDLQLVFPKEIEVTLDQIERIVERGRKYYDQAFAKRAESENYLTFCKEMECYLDDFRDPRRLQQQLQRQIQCEIDDINYTNNVWPKIYEAVTELHKSGKELPFQTLQSA